MLERVVAGLKKGIFPSSRMAAIVGVVVLVILVFIPLIDITMRRLLTHPLPGAYELSEFALGLMVFATLAYCGVRGMHIVVDIVTSQLPLKPQHTVDAVIYFLSWVMTGIISWRLFVRAFIIREQHEVSTILYIPTYPFVFLAGLGFALLTLVFLIQFLDKLSEVTKK